MEECEHCSSMPSNPPSAQCPATVAYPATISAISCRSTALGTSRNIGSATGLGAHTGSRQYIAEACPPLWLIWAKIGIAVRVHRGGDLPVAGDDRPVEAVDQLLVGPVGGVGRVLLGDDEPDAARRAGGVVVGVLLARQAVLGVVGQVRGEHDPVAPPPPGRSAAARTGTGTGWPRSSAASGHAQRLAAAGRWSPAAQIASATRRASSTASSTVRGATQSPARGVPGRAGTGSRPAAGARSARRTRQSTVRCSPVHRSSSSTWSPADRPQQAAQLAGHARPLQPRVGLGQVAGEAPARCRRSGPG